MADIEWVPPSEIPELVYEANVVAIDLETHDPDIKTKGPGWATNNGKVIGVAIAANGWKGYFPVGHEKGPNIDERIFKRNFKKILDKDNIKVFHNAMYDVGWMRQWGLEVKGTIVDTMIAAPLIDENRFRYSLNELSKDYLKEKKYESDLYEAAAQWGTDAKGEMHKLPAMIVGPYAEKDAELTLKLWEIFKLQIVEDELQQVFELETKLFPVLFEMKSKGVRVDLERAERIKKDFKNTEKKILDKILQDTGVAVDVWAAASVAKAFDSAGIKYERTAKSKQPKFDKGFLSNHPSDLARMVVEAREINKASTTFIDTLLKHSHEGRIHAEIHQLRGDKGGTVSGRLSMSNPNLQQIPARHPTIGPAIRSLFIPEEGEQWGSFDYSQQEPRIIVHFAKQLDLAGSSEVAGAYINDPTTDFHQKVAEMANIDRKKAKTINLGLSYGMGQGKLAKELGLNTEDAQDLFKEYHSSVPFIRELKNMATQQASRRGENKGFVRTLMKRKCRFNLWEPDTPFKKRMPGDVIQFNQPLPKQQAQEEYGPAVRRAFTYTAFNRIIQGSAADQTKQAMVDLHAEGITPMIQIHDEIAVSVPDEKTSKRIVDIMENACKLEVPSKVDAELGKNWGDSM
jgi:DNA polymerase I-like protein with 3'-5' exonuclease and polymerase domains